MRDFTPGEKAAHQKEILDLLVLYKTICDKHGLTYFLTAGTLLGAIRHGGFIPWDDDIDVAMPRRDFQIFSQIAQRELGDAYFYQSYKTDPNYPFYFSKIRKNDTEVFEPDLAGISMHKGNYIDIFPLDTCPKHKGVATLYFKAIELIMIALWAKSDPNYQCGYEKKYMIALFRVLRCLPRNLLTLWREAIRKTVDFCCTGEILCTSNGAHGYPRETYQRNWFAQKTEQCFAGTNFPIPTEWHSVLTNMYGDYMTFPPRNQRTEHLKKKENIYEKSHYLRHL